MMTQRSTVPAQSAKILESPRCRTVDGNHRITAISALTKSRSDPSIVVRLAVGEWPDPKVDHPDSLGICDFIKELESEGYAGAIAQGRRDLSTWFDKKLTLRTLRLRAGMSQEQLADLVGTSQSYIARVEAGKHDIQISMLDRLASSLNVDVHAVLDALRV